MAFTTALALAGTTAAPALAVASARSAAHQSVLARTCDPVSGVRTYYSPGKWSKVNANLCVEVKQRADGSKFLQVDYAADLFYYWGLAWYSDCRGAEEWCTVKGSFTLRRNGHTLVDESNFLKHPHNNNGGASTTFNVDSGHWRVQAAVEKRTGYWAFHGSPEEGVVWMNDLAVDITVP
jgi:hypothetical protein